MWDQAAVLAGRQLWPAQGIIASPMPVSGLAANEPTAIPTNDLREFTVMPATGQGRGQPV